MRFAAEKSKHIKSNKFALEDDDDGKCVRKLQDIGEGARFTDTVIIFAFQIF